MSVNVNEGGLNYTASIDDTDLNTRLKTIETNILATGKASVTASDMQVKSIMQLKIQLQSYQAIAEKSTDPARLILYNQKIQDLQIQIQKLGRAGKEGFDSMGNAIEKIAPAVAAVVPQIKEVEVEVEAVTQKVGKFQNAINRATDVQVIGARVVSMFSRQIIGLGVGMLSVTIGAKAIEALAKWVENLRIFNPLASEAKLALEELNKAYASSDYTTAIKNINELTINIDLAKKGFLDKTKVLKEYNTTLGSSIGYADNLNQAEQDIVKNGNAFIKITLLKAVAQLALSDAAKKTYEAQLIAANPPTPFGGKNNNGSFQGNAPAAIKKYYADLNKGQADAEKQKISDLNDQANKFSAIAKKSQQAAADLAKATGIDFFDGTQDPVKTPKVKTDPSVKAGETLVASYKTAFEKLDALKQEYASKEKTKDQQEIDAIKAKFKLETDSLIKLNEARDKFIRNYNKAHAGGGGAAYADKIGAKYIDPSTLDPIQANALSDLAGSQAVEKLKPQVEQMKSLFNEYQAFKLKVGTETADKLYGNELGGFKTYLAYLKSLQPTEAQLNSTDPTIKATASKTKDFLTPLTASASISETVQNQKNLATLLEQNETYEARRKQLIEKANDELVTALKAGYVDQAGVIYTALTAQLKVEDIGQEQKVEAAKKLTETIINETKEQAKITLDAANAKNESEKAHGQISIDTYNKIAKAISDANNLIKSNLLAKSLSEIGQNLSSIGSEISQTNENFGALVSAAGSAMSSISSIMKLAEDMSKNEVQIISDGIQGLIGLIGTLTSAAAARKQAAIDYYNSVIAYQDQYNLALIQQQQIQYQTDGNIFFPDYMAQLKDASKALSSANAESAAALSSLSKGQAIVGQKDVISGANVAKAAGNGAMAGAAIGAIAGGPIGAAVGGVIGAVGGAIVGLFGTKSKNVLTPLLQQYPDLIQYKDGVATLNEVQAKALIANNQVTASTKILLQSAIDLNDERLAAIAQIQDALKAVVGNLGTDLDNALVTAFENGTSAAKAFGDSVSAVISNMIQQFLFEDIFGSKFNDLNQKLKDTVAAGGSSADITKDVTDFFKTAGPLVKLFDDGLTAAKTAGTASGLTLFAPTGAGASSTLSGAIGQSITQNTADILAGSMAGIQLNTLRANGILQSQLLSLGQIANLAQAQLNAALQTVVNTGKTADNTNGLIDTLNKIVANTGSSAATELRAAGHYGYA